MKNYIKLGLSSAFMACLEWWSQEILLVVSGILGVHICAAHVILTNIFELFYFTFVGIQQTSGSLIG